MNYLKKKDGDFLRLLLSTSMRQKRALLKTMQKSQLNAIVQIVYNVLMGNRDLPETDKKDLLKYKKVIRRLVSKSISSKERKRLLLKYLVHVLKFLGVVKKELLI